MIWQSGKAKKKKAKFFGNQGWEGEEIGEHDDVLQCVNISFTSHFPSVFCRFFMYTNFSSFFETESPTHI